MLICVIIQEIMVDNILEFLLGCYNLKCYIKCKIIENLQRGEWQLINYIWCEDFKSGFTFWKILFSTLYNDCIIETKRNNTELRKAASDIQSDGNKYYILMDNAIDNPDVLREMKRLQEGIKGKDNVSILKIHSFEFVLLSFEMLEDWVFAKEDDLKTKRMEIIDTKNAFVNIICNGGDVNELALLKESVDFSETMNTEHIAAKLLFQITRNTGFETNKGKIGDCFIVDCCEWNERQEDDICGLDEKRISSNEKMKAIAEHSVIKDSLREVGL